MKVLLNSFHLNAHTLGFHHQIQRVLQPHLLTQGLNLGVKGLSTIFEEFAGWQHLLLMVFKRKYLIFQYLTDSSYIIYSY